MKKLYVFVVLCVTFMPLSTYAQIKVGDATLPKTVTFNEESLVINGTGIREKFFFDIYAAGLYLKKKNSNPMSIIEADETMALKLHILSSMMSRSKMESALRAGFEKSTGGNIIPLQAKIEKFVGFINTEIEVGQIYDITYEKGKGSVIYQNGEAKGTITGLAFKNALFGIWLGKKPADKDLKKGLLGN